MIRILQARRAQLKQLRSEKRTLIAELRAKRERKKEIDKLMTDARNDIRGVQGRHEDW